MNQPSAFWVKLVIGLMVAPLANFAQDKENKLSIYGGGDVSFFSSLSTNGTVNNADNALHLSIGLSYNTFSLEFTQVRYDFLIVSVLTNLDESEVSIEQFHLGDYMNEIRYGRTYKVNDVLSLGYGIIGGVKLNSDAYYRALPGTSDTLFSGDYFSLGADFRTQLKIFNNFYGIFDLGVKGPVFWSETVRHSAAIFKTHIGLIYRYEL